MISIYIVLTQWQYVLSLFLYLSFSRSIPFSFIFLLGLYFPLCTPSPHWTLKFSCAVYCNFYLQNMQLPHCYNYLQSKKKKKHSHRQLILPRPLPQMPFPISACFVCYSLMYTVSFSCWIIIIYQHDRWQRSEAKHSRMESKMTLALFLFALFISLCLPLFALWLLLFGDVSLLSMLLLSLLVNFTLNYFNVIKKLVTWNSGHLKKLTYS